MIFFSAHVYGASTDRHVHPAPRLAISQTRVDDSLFGKSFQVRKSGTPTPRHTTRRACTRKKWRANDHVQSYNTSQTTVAALTLKRLHAYCRTVARQSQLRGDCRTGDACVSHGRERRIGFALIEARVGPVLGMDFTVLKACPLLVKITCWCQPRTPNFVPGAPIVLHLLLHRRQSFSLIHQILHGLS